MRPPSQPAPLLTMCAAGVQLPTLSCMLYRGIAGACCPHKQEGGLRVWASWCVARSSPVFLACLCDDTVLPWGPDVRALLICMQHTLHCASFARKTEHKSAVMRVQYQRKESLQFIPGRMHQQDVLLDQAGNWLVQCRTTNHFDAGMAALLSVTAASSMPPPHEDPPCFTYSAAHSGCLRGWDTPADDQIRHHACDLRWGQSRHRMHSASRTILCLCAARL